MPVDANLQSEAQVEYDYVQADIVLAFMEESGAKIKIMILDACFNGASCDGMLAEDTGIKINP